MFAFAGDRDNDEKWIWWWWLRDNLRNRWFAGDLRIGRDAEIARPDNAAPDYTDRNGLNIRRPYNYYLYYFSLTNTHWDKVCMD